MNKEKICFLFSGQGAQYVGMGKEIYENYKIANEVFNEGEKILGMDIKNLIFNGPIEELSLTENAQPAIILTEMALMRVLIEEGIEAKYSIGLSLGEYGSLMYGNVLSFEEGLKLIKERGRIMGSSLPKGLGKMAAILKLNDENMKELIERASQFGVCEGANYNCPGQTVIAGEGNAIDEAVKIAKELGGLAIPLNVSGPFHSSLLNEASEEFYKQLEKITLNDTDKIIYSNVKGLPYEKDDNVKELLKKHMCTPVYFEKAIRDMINKGIDTFIEIGPGKTLTGFIKKIDRKVKALNIDNLESLRKVVEEIKGN